MVIPCNLPSPTDSPPYTTASGDASDDTDIFFVVGPPGDTWTISAKNQVLKKNEILKLLIRNSTGNIRLEDVDKRGFELLVKHLEGSESKFATVQTARNTLDVAHKFQCGSLIKYCIHYLDFHLGIDNVLIVFKNLAQYSNNAHSNEPSAPMHNVQTPSDTGRAICEMCSALLHNCLIIIDKYCPEIITQESFETISHQDLLTITSRETLNIPNEILLFDSLLRWYNCQCMKMGNLPQNPTTRRQVLGDVIFKVRYGLMKRSKFLSGPGQSGLFTTNEVNEILSIIDNNVASDGLYRNMNVKRTKINNDEPMFLSGRTEHKTRKVKRKDEAGKVNNTWLNCLFVWSVLFD